MSRNIPSIVNNLHSNVGPTSPHGAIHMLLPAVCGKWSRELSISSQVHQKVLTIGLAEFVPHVATVVHTTGVMGDARSVDLAVSIPG